jgi:hypothetical protein
VRSGATAATIKDAVKPPPAADARIAPSTEARLEMASVAPSTGSPGKSWVAAGSPVEAGREEGSVEGWRVTSVLLAQCVSVLTVLAAIPLPCAQPQRLRASSVR